MVQFGDFGSGEGSKYIGLLRLKVGKKRTAHSGDWEPFLSRVVLIGLTGLGRQGGADWCGRGKGAGTGGGEEDGEEL
eukprot:COSAG02_NODE_5539_length_4245_cov_4.083213_3_plen_77_part_00